VRYPGHTADRDLARHALAIAREVRACVRSRLS